jgi:exonuclease SbcC
MKANLSDHNKGLTILYAEHQNRMEELRTALQGVQKEISSQTTFISSRNGVVESLRQHITTITSALEGMETHKTVASMEPVHTSNLAGVNADLERTTDEYRASVSAATAYNGKNTELTMKRLELENLKKQRAQELKTATDQYEDTLRRAQLLTMGDLDCKADGSGWVNDNCKLLKDAVAARDRLPVLAAARDALMYHSDEILALTADIETGEKWFADTPDPAVDIERLTEEGKRLRKESEKIAALLEESRAAAKTVADLQTKATMLEFKQKELTETLDSIKTAKEAIAALRETETGWLDKSDAAEEDYKQKVNAVVEKERALTLEIAELEKTLTGDVEKQLAELRLAAEDIQREITAHEHLVSKATGDIAVEKNKLAEIGHKKDERDRLAAERQTIDEEIVNWQLITKACSNDGIIALELDDAGPAIAGLANDLLLACYGPRFSVRLETQSVKADGTLKETFDITVFDSERDEEKSIRDMSGGEVTTIEDAIARAICLYNLGKSSVVYDTLFSDEKDGALDAHRKVEFLQIKRRAMELGTHSREIFISQTPELHEMADARIVLTSAGVVIQ